MFASFALAASLFMATPDLPQTPRPTPSARQLEWQKLDYYAFIHFGPNTFSGVEWGKGTEDPKIFNPSALDARQWVKTFKDAGMTQVVITAKHHDGFCLWPSKFSNHTVKQSAWKNGKGDVLREVRNACDEFGLKMGVYLSPWDRNHPAYGTPEYNQVFANTLKEVLTTYGPIYEVWFDGANGEGPNGKKQVYDWPLFISTVRKYAPKAVIFSDAGPDIRWVGNEQGFAPETSWSKVRDGYFAVGTPLYKELGEGHRDGDIWRPSESDVSIRPGWFYHADQDDDVKSPEVLLDLWERSVGHNSAFLLNVPPDRRGLIHENDVKSLLGFRKLRDQIYGRDLLKSAADRKTSKTMISARLDEPKVIDRVSIREDIKSGQRVAKFTLTLGLGDKTVHTQDATTIGNRRILRTPPVKADWVQIDVLESDGDPKLTNLQAFATPSAELDMKLPELAADKEKRIAWWREARFGMFIHWGLYAIPAGEWKGKVYGGASEWLMHTAQVPAADWAPLQQQFNPVNYDPEKWVKIAKDAGMKYIVITSKHHEGFALWDSKLTTWDVGGTPYRKDLLKPLAEACRKAGIKLGFYHSIMDWTHPDYGLRRPWDLRPQTPTNMDRYTEFMKGQLKELLTEYGDVAVLWFDGEWEPQAWTHERGKDLYAYVRSLQPNILINNRVDVFRSGMGGFNSNDRAVGDFGTPEQEIPAAGMPGVDWESCMTFNDSWGYHKTDQNWKSATTIVRNLIDCASKGGNYLLNVGPTALGEIPQASVDRLSTVGAWLRTYGESIYGSQAGPFPKPLPWGKVTMRKGVLYCHVFDLNATQIELVGFKGKIKRAADLATDMGAGSLMMGYGKDGPILPVPQTERDDALAGLPRVIVVEVEDGFTVEVPPLRQNPDGSLALKAIEANVNGHSARYEDRADRQCIGFWTNPADTVEWTFEIDRPGEFLASIELACEAGSEGAEFEVSVHGSAVRGKVPATKGWGDFVKIDLGKLAIVTAGSHKLVVKPLTKPGAGVMNLRGVQLRPAR